MSSSYYPSPPPLPGAKKSTSAAPVSSPFSSFPQQPSPQRPQPGPVPGPQYGTQQRVAAQYGQQAPAPQYESQQQQQPAQYGQQAPAPQYGSQQQQQPAQYGQQAPSPQYGSQQQEPAGQYGQLGGSSPYQQTPGGASGQFGVVAPQASGSRVTVPQAVTPPGGPPQGGGDWFGNTGFATAIGAAAMSAMAGNDKAVQQIMATTFDAEKQKSLSWFQTQSIFFKEYFNVTHAYVGWKLVFVLLPFVQSQSSQMVSRAASRDVPTSDDTDEQTASQGSGVGLRLFPGRKPDLYIPIMGFITFVLIHSLSKWTDFHPDDLYNIASLGILLGFIEVLILKGASYVLNVAHWKFTDVFAVCGYKFANLSFSILIMVLLAFGGRALWIGVYVFASAMAGITVHRGLIAAGSYNASTQHYLGTPHSQNMERLMALVAGAAQFFWLWILMPAMKTVAVATVIGGGNAGVAKVIESTGVS